jgi:uncharacterized protein DUF4260
MLVQSLARPTLLLRVEGGVLLLAALVIYGQTGGNWWLFALLLLAPDLSMLGYRAGNATGAAVYNLAHTEVFPALLSAAGLLAGQPVLLSLALIWFAHIGMDRVLGYGLKFPGGFKQTHLGA